MSRLELYQPHYRGLARVCMDLSLGGFLVDEARRAELEREAATRLDELKREIRVAAPFDLFGKGKRKGEDGKGLSSPKINGYFYDTLKCKPYFNPGTKSRTCDEEAIRRLMRAYKKARRVGQLVLDFRQWEKRQQFLDAERVDDDGRFRSLYVPTAVSGRLQSSENPLGTGSNAQNLPRPPSPVRSIFIPDRGHVLIELDYSRIEDRLLGGMSGDKRMAREAQPGSSVDTYQDVADELEIAEAFGALFGPVTSEDDDEPLRRPSVRAYYVRQTGKRTKLAAGYGMRGPMMSRATLLETEGVLALDPRQCDAWLDKLYKLRPGIPNYQAWVRERILDDGYLENSWGRRIWFRKLRLADGDHRDGYAWCCQSENGINTNQLGFRPAAKLAKAMGGDEAMRVVQQGHDALVMSVRAADAYEVLRHVSGTMGAEREYPGAKGPWSLACPIGFKLGPRWGEAMVDWKKRPSPAEFDKALARVLGEVWWRRGGTRARAAG